MRLASLNLLERLTTWFSFWYFKTKYNREIIVLLNEF